MWFRNLQLFRLTHKFDFSAEELDAQLKRKPSRDCGSLEPNTIGWEPPLGRHGRMLTHGVAQFIMICAKRQEKVLPASVVSEQLESKVAVIEESEGRKIRHRERQDLKDGLLLELLPKAFTKSSLIYAYIDRRDGWLVINAPSAKKGEELITLLRDTLGTLPLRPLEVALSPTDTMTRWLKGKKLPKIFSLGDECELRDSTGEGGVVRCRGQDLQGDEISAHLRAGKQVFRLSLEWQQRISMVLGEDLAIRRLKFLESIREEAAADEAEEPASRFDADFALMTLEFSRFLPALVDSLGGEAKES